MQPFRLLAVTWAGVAATAITIMGATPAAWAGGGGGSVCPGFARGSTLAMQDSCFAGTAHLIEPGTTELAVVNRGAAPHTITAVDGSFDLHLDPGESGSLALNGASVIPIYCTLHGTPDGAGMAGAIAVDARAGEPSSAVGSVLGAAPRDAGLAGPGDDSTSRVGWAVASAAAVVGATSLGAAGISARRRRLA